ncbi:teneurin-3-like [Ptychodera flava]|uniref:teneurin-3-like n=1 Tax=Ptychodera flava TaxID=63121 RepID=UPI00396AAC58
MCDEVDCIPSDCNTNGQCIDGVCHCDTDWQGDDCSIVHRPCLNDCSGHGDCDNMTGICSCHDDWQKQDCSEVKCGDHDCSGLGVCHNGTCECDAGWTGQACTERDCEYGCREHGSCQSGTCICNKGWTGTACELDVCPNNCSVNGDCLLVENSWQCVCQGDFKGADCAITYESTCDDGIDNDQDTFIDCEDPDCCNDTVCESLASCSYSDSPEEYAQTNESATQHFYDQVSFLFEESGIQQEVEEGYIQPSLISVLRGYVTNRDGTPLQGVTIAIQGFSQYGYTTTRKDGGFDMAVNGGGVLTATFSKMNFIGAQRSVQPTINQYFVLSKIVILLGIDPKVTKIDLDSDKIQIAEGSESEDAAGKRKGVIMFHPGTEATVVSYNGTDNQTLTKPSVRITEYTVGENGEEAMPAQLPPFTGYTYAMELSMDEAAVNGSTDVFFNQKLYYYVEDYLGFPVGSAVPTGFYNRSRGEWVPSENGLVIELVTPDDPNRASVDVTGTGTPATEEELVKLGFNDQELEALADLYTPGQKLWRVPIPHFTPWDCNWPYGPPTNSCVPAECNDLPEPFDDCNEGSTTPINQNAPTQNPDPPEESPAPTNGYNPNLPVQSPEIIKEVTPKYPRIPTIPYVPGVPSIPGIPSDPGLPVLPSVPLPGREEQSPRHWFAVNPNIPDDVENPGDFGPPPGTVCNNASWDIDKDLGYWKPNGSIELRDLSKSPGTIHKPIPGTSLNLVYNHNRHAGYKSLMKIPVTGDNVPSIMQKVVVEVTIAGKTFTKELTPSPNLTESIVWDGKDTYGRAIKGSEKAKVKIGYKYGLQYYPVRSEFQQSFNRLSQADTRSTLARRDRAVTYWEDREMDVVRNLLNPGLGGWSFDIHHSYDAIAGTLHTGSGDVIGYRDKNKVLKTVAGSAVRAGIDCRTCGEGFGEDTELRLPVAVAASPDGSVFLGDYNFIRRIWPNGTVSTVTQLVDTRPKQRYYMAVNPRTGLLYISDSTRRQVLYIDPSTGEEKVFAGTGERCPPWENGCGDNGLAVNAKLNTPKGILGFYLFIRFQSKSP